jgi:hypothetical protein
MGFDQSRLNDLAASYGMYSSWAVWNPAKPADAAIIADHVAELNTSAVLVALNISRPIPAHWQNFHSQDHARKLMYAFNESPFRGAYMTDLIKGEVETKAGRLSAKVSSGGINLRKHVDTFRAEMGGVGVHEHSLFILFGNKVEQLFAAHLGVVYPNHVKCPHYSSYGKGYTDSEWVEKTWSILEAHCRSTKAAFNTLPFVRTELMVARLGALKAQQERRKEGQWRRREVANLTRASS